MYFSNQQISSGLYLDRKYLPAYVVGSDEGIIKLKGVEGQS